MSSLHSKRMVLIPEELVSLLRERQQETVSPVTKNLVSLKDHMGDILERQDLRPDEKAKLYGQAFQRYQNVREQRENKPVTVQIVPTKSESNSSPTTVKKEVKGEIPADQVSTEIIQSVPKTLKNRAELLMQKLKQRGDVINWNDRGELVYNGKDVRGSNMLDLVNDVLRNRKSSTPQGWEYFARGLAHMNIPNELIHNTKRRRIIDQIKQDPSVFQPIQSEGESKEQDWSDEEVFPDEDVGLKRLMFSPTVRKQRKRKAEALTPRIKHSPSLGGIKKRLARWSPLPYGD